MNPIFDNAKAVNYVTKIEGKPNKNILERLPDAIFTYFFEYIDIDSIINFQRGSNKVLLSRCHLALSHRLNKMKELNNHDLQYLRALRSHRPLQLSHIDNSFHDLFKAVPNITHLNLDGITRIIEKIPELTCFLDDYWPTISSLSLKDDFSETVKTVLTQCNINLTYLDISVGYKTNSLFYLIGERFTKLKHLNINDCKPHNNPLGLELKFLLMSCTNLHSLSMVCCHATDEVADYFISATQLTALDISYNFKMTARAVQKIAESCKALTSFDISRIPMDNHALEAIIINCRDLTKIGLGFNLNLDYKMLARCIKLHSIVTDFTIRVEAIVFLVRSCTELANFIIWPHKTLNIARIRLRLENEPSYLQIGDLSIDDNNCFIRREDFFKYS